jgi:hypothetical protein
LLNTSSPPFSHPSLLCQSFVIILTVSSFWQWGWYQLSYRVISKLQWNNVLKISKTIPNHHAAWCPPCARNSSSFWGYSSEQINTYFHGEILAGRETVNTDVHRHCPLVEMLGRKWIRTPWFGLGWVSWKALAVCDQGKDLTCPATHCLRGDHGMF